MSGFPVSRGEFNLLSKIGEGGMAEVFLAERGGDEGFRTRVALKRLHSGFSLDQYFIRQLVAEARLLGQLQHHNIVRVHDFRRIEDEHFIVMEYIDGIDLAQAIHVHRQHGFKMPLPVFFQLALSICEALDYAHNATDLNGRPMELVHRDIKPSNVLISHRGTVKLTDFGIARVADSTHTASVVKGTANYMSPEQASGDQDLTPASDIFSLGAVFWEILTLEKLVDGTNYLNVLDSIRAINVGLKDITRRGIEPALRMVLLRMLAHKSELRYQSVALVLKDLRFVVDQMKIDLSPAPMQEYMTRVVGLAREAAAVRVQASAAAPAPPATPATPAVSPDGAAGEAHGGSAKQAFKDSVVALQKLVQSGASIPKVAAAAEPNKEPPPQQPAPRPAPPSAAPPSAPALRAVPAIEQAAAVAPAVEASTPRSSVAVPPAAAPPLVRRNTVSSLASEPHLKAASAGSATPPVTVSAVDSYADDATEEEELTWDDDYDIGHGSSLRRASFMVWALGLPVILILLGVIGWLLYLPGSDSEVDGSQAETVAGQDAAEFEPPVVAEEQPPDESKEAPDSSADLELVLAAGDAPVEGWAEAKKAPAERRDRKAVIVPSEVRSRPADRERRDDFGPEFEPQVREPEPVLERWEPAPAPEPEPEPEVDDWDAAPAPPADSERWEPESEPTNEETWIPEPVGESSDWAVSGDSKPSSEGGAVEVNTASLGDLAGLARRGDLRDQELDALEAIAPESPLYNSGRALLLAHFEARRDTRSHCEVAVETLRQPANRAAPQFHLEMSKCHLREGRHQEALESARIAEMNAQDIPARVRADRQLKIWEVQAKAFKGMYQSTDDLDYIADSIAVWKRYLHMSTNTYRQRESERAQREIDSLLQLQAGAL
ncbi:MAG: hypothetical protein CMP23_07375 [Rickettsiales bacterium]|nr:hypothetical protein [Rickettsiales bacterium]